MILYKGYPAYILVYPKVGELGQWYNICKGTGAKHGLGDVIFETQDEGEASRVHAALLRGDMKPVDMGNRSYLIVEDAIENSNGDMWTCLCAKHGQPNLDRNSAPGLLCGVLNCENEAEYYLDLI